jgi:hypothetical protein
LARAQGKIPTGAKWIREKILASPHYNQDSKLGPQLITELTDQILNLKNPDNVDRARLLGLKR